jgi:hypothetical protein
MEYENITEDEFRDWLSKISPRHLPVFNPWDKTRFLYQHCDSKDDIPFLMWRVLSDIPTTESSFFVSGGEKYAFEALEKLIKKFSREEDQEKILTALML